MYLLPLLGTPILFTFCFYKYKYCYILLLIEVSICIIHHILYKLINKSQVELILETKYFKILKHTVPYSYEDLELSLDIIKRLKTYLLIKQEGKVHFELQKKVEVKISSRMFHYWKTITTASRLDFLEHELNRLRKEKINVFI